MINQELEKLTNNEYYLDIWAFQLNHPNIPQVRGFYKVGVLNLLIANGFKKLYQGDVAKYVRDDNNILTEVSREQIQDFVKGYVYKEDGELKYKLNGNTYKEKRDNLKNKFLDQSHLIFNHAFLNNLPIIEKPPLRDKLDTIYLPFKNGVLVIKPTNYRLYPFSELKGHYLFKEQIIQKEFIDNGNREQSQFEKFISNISNQDKERIAVFESALGYLIHNYNDIAKGKAVICYDEEITEKDVPMGGTGKGIFASSLMYIRKVAKIDGKKFDGKDKFAFQEVDSSTQIVIIQDVGNNFDIERLNSLLTDGFNVESKHKSSYTIEPEHAPKVIITSNIILRYDGTTNRRRQLILEFGNHYSSQIINGAEEPIIVEHGQRFFSEWDAKEWDRFYHYLVKCTVSYLKNGLQYKSPSNVFANRLQQQTNKEFYTWITNQKLDINKWWVTKEKYLDFKNLYYQNDDSFKQRGFTEWLKLFAKSINCKIEFKTLNGDSQFRLYKN